MHANDDDSIRSSWRKVTICTSATGRGVPLPWIRKVQPQPPPTMADEEQPAFHDDGTHPKPRTTAPRLSKKQSLVALDLHRLRHVKVDESTTDEELAAWITALGKELGEAVASGQEGRKVITEDERQELENKRDELRAAWKDRKGSEIKIADGDCGKAREED